MIETCFSVPAKPVGRVLPFVGVSRPFFNCYVAPYEDTK